MKNLYLVRHAKSSWKLPVDDLKRPLKKRGILDAILISDHIKNYEVNDLENLKWVFRVSLGF